MGVKVTASALLPSNDRARVGLKTPMMPSFCLNINIYDHQFFEDAG